MDGNSLLIRRSCSVSQGRSMRGDSKAILRASSFRGGCRPSIHEWPYNGTVCGCRTKSSRFRTHGIFPNGHCAAGTTSLPSA